MFDGRGLRILVASVAIAAIVAAVSVLQVSRSGLYIESAALGSIPVTTFSPAETAETAPAVVIAHGFAGSQQLMQQFAVTLARNGYIAITFDFPGHGRNGSPLPGGLIDHEGRSRSLDGALDTVVGYARMRVGANGRLALIGHSMASDIIVRYAMAHPDIAASVALSLFAPGVTATAPRNLLIVDGALEPAMLKNEARRIVGVASAGPAQEGVTYGRYADGSARRVVFADGVEHIGVLYSRESLNETLGWLDAVFDRRGNGFVDGRGIWLALMYAGVVALAWPHHSSCRASLHRRRRRAVLVTRRCGCSRSPLRRRF